VGILNFRPGINLSRDSEYFIIQPKSQAIYMVQATIIYYSKIYVKHDHLDTEVVIELKVWELPVSEKYPNGIKYSLFCVNVEDSRVVVGFDNHHPKGHHLHIDDEEQHYFYVDEEKLIEDFYSLVKARGYSI
jgi:hypothetical protein